VTGAAVNDPLFQAPSCPHPSAAGLRTCEGCGFTYCRRCSDDLGCPRCRGRAFARDEARDRSVLRNALWWFVAGAVFGEVVLIGFTATHLVAGIICGLLIGYGVLCAFWVAANRRRLQEALDISNREASAGAGCVQLFAPLLVLLVVPVLVYTPFDMWHVRSDVRRGRNGYAEIVQRMRSGDDRTAGVAT